MLDDSTSWVGGRSYAQFASCKQPEEEKKALCAVQEYKNKDQGLEPGRDYKKTTVSRGRQQPRGPEVCPGR